MVSEETTQQLDALLEVEHLVCGTDKAQLGQRGPVADLRGRKAMCCDGVGV